MRSLTSTHPVMLGDHGHSQGLMVRTSCGTQLEQQVVVLFCPNLVYLLVLGAAINLLSAWQLGSLN